MKEFTGYAIGLYANLVYMLRNACLLRLFDQMYMQNLEAGRSILSCGST